MSSPITEPPLSDPPAPLLDAWISSLTEHLKTAFSDKTKELEKATKKLKDDTKELEDRKKEFELEKKIHIHEQDKAKFDLEKEREKIRAKFEDDNNLLKASNEALRLKEMHLTDLATVLQKEKTILVDRQFLLEEKFDSLYKVKSPHHLQTHS